MKQKSISTTVGALWLSPTIARPQLLPSPTIARPQLLPVPNYCPLPYSRSFVVVPNYWSYSRSFVVVPNYWSSVNSSPVMSLDREQMHAWERSGRGTKSGWMSPVEIDELGDPTGPDKLLAEDARRASSKGFLSLSLQFYLDLLDWTGRNLALGKRAAIPDHLDPILKRVGIVSSGWCDLIEQFGRLFKRAVGSRQSLAGEAEARGQKYLQAPGATAFVSL